VRANPQTTAAAGTPQCTSLGAACAYPTEREADRACRDQPAGARRGSRTPAR
jgi:hypothetical protein